MVPDGEVDQSARDWRHRGGCGPAAGDFVEDRPVVLGHLCCAEPALDRGPAVAAVELSDREERFEQVSPVGAAPAGLMRYGLIEEAHRIIDGLLAVAGASDGRLPELFAGLSRDEVSVPAAYPASCVPQAWAAAAPLLLIRAMLRLEPSAAENGLWSLRLCHRASVAFALTALT